MRTNAFSRLCILVCLVALPLTGCGLVGASGVGYLIYTSVEEDPPDPRIDSVTPAVSEEDGGAQATIAGADFDGPRVFLGSTEATVDASSKTEIIFTFPALAVGAYALRVENDEGGDALVENAVTYQDTVAPDAVSDLAAAKGGAVDEVVLTWSAVGDNGGTGTAASYEIRYATAPIDDGNWASATVATVSPAVTPGPPGTAESTTVTGLPPSTYYFAIQVTDDQGNPSLTSNSPDCDIAPPGRIEDLVVLRATSVYTFRLGFLAPADDGHDASTGDASSYAIKYSVLPLLTQADFDAAKAVEFTAAPGAAGAQQTIEVTVPSDADGPLAVGGEKLYFAVQATDDASNVSEISVNGAEVLYEKHPMITTGSFPAKREGACMAYNSRLRRLMVYGGRDGGGERNELFGLDVRNGAYGRWIAYTNSGAPGAGRTLSSLVYDPVADRLLLFGGFAGGAVGDLWEITLAGTTATWNQLSLSGEPTARYGHTAVYDPLAHRMILYGGTNGTSQRVDCRELALEKGSEAWASLGTTGQPTARYGHAAAFDPLRNRMLVFGGSTDGSAANDELWELSFQSTNFGSWRELTSLSAGTRPAASMHMTAAYDPVNFRFVVGGGIDPSDGSVRGTLYGFDCKHTAEGTWADLHPRAGHPAVYAAASAYDAESFRMVTFAGNDGSDFQSDVHAFHLYPLNVASDYAVSTPVSRPPARSRASMAWLGRNAKLVLFGGDCASGPSSSTWIYDLQSPAATAWLPVATAVTPNPPTAKYGASLVFATQRNEAVMFGGTTDGTDALTELHSFDVKNPAWNEVTPSGGPPVARHGHCAIYDPVHRRMVVYGGANPGLWRQDTWLLTLGTGTPAWTQAIVAAPPNGRRAYGAAAYDPVWRRMIVVGGRDSTGTRFGDVLSFDLSGGLAGPWVSLKVYGSKPPVLSDHTAYYDEANRRVVVVGGRTDAGLNTTAYALYLRKTEGMWMALPQTGSVTPAVREGSVGCWDGIRQRYVGFGGEDGSGTRLDDTLLYGAPEVEPDLTAGELAVSGTAPSIEGHAWVHDARNDRMLVFGGRTDMGLTAAVWEVTGLSTSAPAWSLVSTSGTGPTPREGSLCVHNFVTNTLYVFGGYDGTNYQRDVHGLSFATNPATWFTIPEAGGSVPTQRAYCAGVWVLTGSLAVYGGETTGGNVLVDCWAFNLTSGTWNQLAMDNPLNPGQDPLGRSRMSFDTVYFGLGMYVYGGKGQAGTLRDLWFFDFTNQDWIRMQNAGATQDPTRYSASMLRRPFHKGVEIACGFGNAATGSVWRYQNEYSPILNGTWGQHKADPALAAGYGRAAVFDEVNRRLILFGGLDSGNQRTNKFHAVRFFRNAGGRYVRK